MENTTEDQEPATGTGTQPAEMTMRYRYRKILSGHLKINKTKVLNTDGSLMQVESIAECSLEIQVH